ncbi:hypothetical protein [Aggregatilinea lenta]|uniref:hypothetical protein n=1 Tax=Aggregatilinea lenta TaxID=913108 RepID=UPI000E5A4300|nr:hypothetical protein [Aggregatilinea lenta]
MDPIRKHRREFWLRIVAPIAIPALALIVLAVVLIVAVAAGSMISKQITVTMSMLASAFILLPMVLLCIIPYVLAAVMAAGAGMAYAKVQIPLRFVRRITAQIAQKTHSIAPRTVQPLIAMNARIARLESTARGWQTPESDLKKGQS